MKAKFEVERARTGLTLKQMAAHRLYEAMDAYRTALRSHDHAAILSASMLVYAARRNNSDRTLINRAFRESSLTPSPVRR